MKLSLDLKSFRSEIKEKHFAGKEFLYLPVQEKKLLI